MKFVNLLFANFCKYIWIYHQILRFLTFIRTRKHLSRKSVRSGNANLSRFIDIPSMVRNIRVCRAEKITRLKTLTPLNDHCFSQSQQIAVIFHPIIIIVRFIRAFRHRSGSLRNRRDPVTVRHRDYISIWEKMYVCVNVCERYESGFKSPFGSFDHFSSLFLNARCTLHYSPFNSM